MLQRSPIRIIIFVVILTCLAAFFHFYNLNWGAPFYFHPDERNIASSVSQLNFPKQMNPHFFAYGSLAIYTIYFTGLFINMIGHFFTPLPLSLNPTFEQAIIISRLYSALFATLLVPLLFSLGKKLKNDSVGVLAAFFATTSTGFMQFAHFGTFEMWLTFFTTVLLGLSLVYKDKKTDLALLLLGVVSGILVSIKISHLAIIPIILFVIFFQELYHHRDKHHLYKTARTLRGFFLFFIITFVIYCTTNPFVFIDPQAFRDSMKYESGVVLGTLPVFYTGEFFHTIPVLFQFLHIYPFLINPVLMMAFIPAFCSLIFTIIKYRHISFLLLASYFLLLFFSQAFFFAKWTRYMIPTLPFVYLIIAVIFSDVIVSKAKQSLTRLPRCLLLLAMIIVIFVNILFTFSYFVTAFWESDTRIAASTFAKQTIPPEAPILSEVYDLGITPFNNSFSTMHLFQFYDLDNNSVEATPDILQAYLKRSDYIILQSQRILKTRLQNPTQFPKGNAFYHALLSGKLGYKKIYESPCDIFCKITYLGNPTFSFEETANVFDRPTVMIFKKED